MSVVLENMSVEHRNAVIDIFNHYIENSFSAYPENKAPYEFFDMFLGMALNHPAVVAEDETGRVVAFAMLRPYHPMKAFQRTAEISYFVAPDRTGAGVGQKLLSHLEDEARKIGVDTLLADISSLNPMSISFHLKNGFKECGRFEKVGRKFNRDFDQVWMQKIL